MIYWYCSYVARFYIFIIFQVKTPESSPDPSQANDAPSTQAGDAPSIQATPTSAVAPPPGNAPDPNTVAPSQALDYEVKLQE